MENVTAGVLGLTSDVFIIALHKLQSEGLISGAAITQTWGGLYIDETFNRFMMTPQGIEYVEEKALIDKTLSGSEKIGALGKTLGEWAQDTLENIAAKALAEMVKH